MFRLCKEFATEEDIDKAISLCKTEAPMFRCWFQYYWFEEMPLESILSKVGILTVTSFLGHRRGLDRLLCSPKNLDSQTISSALFWTIRQGHDACFGKLIKTEECDLRNPRNRDHIPLLAASQFGRLDCLRLLLEDYRVDINTQESLERSALFLATASNDFEVVQKL